MSIESEPDYVLENRRMWDDDAPEWVASGERLWAGDPEWGIWGIPERQLAVLPDDMSGMDAIELGCGTGYVSGWMSRRGAAVTAIDNSEQQLATARRLAAVHGADIKWMFGNAETVPLPDSSFDFAISEYGAAIWADPRIWVPEAWRLLKPGGVLSFISNTALAMACSPLDGSDVTFNLERPYFGMGRLDWTGVEIEPGGISFCLTTPDWMRLFRDSGFTIENFVEIQAPQSAEGKSFFVSAEWARLYPSEQLWTVRK